MAYDIYMKVDGITGDAPGKGYAGQFEVLSLGYGVANPYNLSNSGSGRAAFTPITVTLDDDKVPLFFTAVASGKHFATVKITVTQSGAGTAAYETIALTNVVFTQLQSSTSGGDRPVMELALAYSTILITQTITSSNGEPTTVTGGWDVVRNAPL